MNDIVREPSSPTPSDTELLEGLDNDELPPDQLAAYRSRRMKELQASASAGGSASNKDPSGGAGRRTRWNGGSDKVKGGYGEMMQIKDEKELISQSSKEPRCLMHFYHRDFARCRIMDRHLESLAPKYPSTLFLRTSVEDAPFLVHRLGVKVLPCVISFVTGNAVDRVVGFADLGNQDDFATAVLELRLKKCGGYCFQNYISLRNEAGFRRSTGVFSSANASRRRDSAADSDSDYERSDDSSVELSRKRI